MMHRNLISALTVIPCQPAFVSILFVSIIDADPVSTLKSTFSNDLPHVLPVDVSGSPSVLLPWQMEKDCRVQTFFP